MKKEIEKIIIKAVNSIYSDFNDRANLSINVERPKEISHGDYSTNVALALAKQLKKNPMEVAQEILKRIKSELFKKVEIVYPGFINFYLSKDFFIEQIKNVDKNFGKNQSLKNQKVIVEFTDPNPFKEFHIGHLMSNSIGESIARIFEFQGAKVKRGNYQGDVGLHVAKAVWGKIFFPKWTWAGAYAHGSAEYENNETAKKEIIELNKKIFERSDKSINKLYDQGKKDSLVYFEEIYKKLGTKFDYYFFESEVAGFGKKIVEEGMKKGIFEKGEKGAIVFKGEKFGLHTRVFINAEGLPTYEAKELGLAQIKYKKYKYGASIIITGNEINDYFKVLMAAMAQIFPDLQKKTTHIGHGMLRLPEGKMSSRTGKVITAEFLIGEVKKMVEEKMAGRDIPQKEKETIIEQVAIGALKYSILKQSIGSNIVYDFEKSISFDGDAGPYLQYSYARAISVLNKAKSEKVKASLKNVPTEVGQLEKMMSHFPEIVEKAGREYEPHIIVLYLTELAREFNNYYAYHKIVDSDDEFSSYKVALTEAFCIVMKNGLWLLGISVPEKM